MEIHHKNIDIQTQDGICDAYVAYPKQDGKFPSVIFLMDGYGLRPYLNEMADTLASHGYFVLQPNLLYRAKRSPIVSMKFPLKPEDLPQARSEMLPLARSYNPELGLNDVEIFLNYLSEQKSFNGKIATTGYCMGGSMSIRSAARYPDRISVAASFHAGNLATDAENSPHLLLPKIKARFYVAHADNDASMTAEQIEKFNQAASKVSVPHKVELYSGALHGFTMKDLPAYNEEALSRHWTELFSLLKQM